MKTIIALAALAALALTSPAKADSACEALKLQQALALVPQIDCDPPARSTHRAAVKSVKPVKPTLPATAPENAHFCQENSADVLARMQALFETRTRLYGTSVIDLDDITTVYANPGTSVVCHVTVEFNSGDRINEPTGSGTRLTRTP